MLNDYTGKVITFDKLTVSAFMVFDIETRSNDGCKMHGMQLDPEQEHDHRRCSVCDTEFIQRLVPEFISVDF